VAGKEGPCREAKRSDVAERADIKKSAPAQPVNQPESDKSENQIGDANADRLQQRGFCARPVSSKMRGAKYKIALMPDI
jgi:hypothetical protein